MVVPNRGVKWIVDLTGLDLNGAEIAGVQVGPVWGRFFYAEDVRNSKPESWVDVEKKIRRGLKDRRNWQLLGDRDIRARLEAMNQRVGKEMEFLNKYQERPSFCVWHDGSGVFQNWAIPDRSCGSDMLDAVCEKESPWIFHGLADIHVKLDTASKMQNALSILERESATCSGLTREIRLRVCHAVNRKIDSFSWRALEWREELKEGIVKRWSAVQTSCREIGMVS